VTNDGFFLAIEARDPRFSEMETHDLLVETADCTYTIRARGGLKWLRGFFSHLPSRRIVIVAMCGFRGEHGTRTPWEIFPDMVRHTKSPGTSTARFFR
jgi:hypothetical protein